MERIRLQGVELPGETNIPGYGHSSVIHRDNKNGGLHTLAADMKLRMVIVVVTKGDLEYWIPFEATRKLIAAPKSRKGK